MGIPCLSGNAILALVCLTSVGLPCLNGSAVLDRVCRVGTTCYSWYVIQIEESLVDSTLF